MHVYGPPNEDPQRSLLPGELRGIYTAAVARGTGGRLERARSVRGAASAATEGLVPEAGFTPQKA